MNALIECLRGHGVELAPGLTDDEIALAERTHQFRFPPDLRALLQDALPVTEYWPNWRDPTDARLVEQFAWPWLGIELDIESHSFWLPRWGPRPASNDEALAIARRAYDTAPRLVPLFSRRYLPDTPHRAGNPVLSVAQTDIIYDADDLASALGCAPLGDTRETMTEPIPFWSEIANGDGHRRT